ncbi:glycosyltransferase [Rickettsiales bacterium]|nr:glycosyltransferase [Rickettsiales bacterium]
MAKIIMCYHSIGGNSKYQDFADSLINNNNNVIQFNISSYGERDLNRISDKLYNYNPDLVFSYNNSLPEKLFLNLKCPILIIDADNPGMFFHKESLSKCNKDNLYYLLYQTNSKKLYKQILGIDIGNNYAYFPPSSDFQKDSAIQQDINISFIGSNFYMGYKDVSQDFNEDFFKLLNKVKSDYYYTECGEKKMLDNVRLMLAGQQRINYLSTLSDLGLIIYSNTNWRESVSPINLDVAICYQDKMVTTKIDNQSIYNRSKISLNLSHNQANNSFSWRVPDIMASNSCLLMENKIDWHTAYGQHISTEVKESIIYTNQYDMRSKCIRLLNDDNLRSKCVIECQKAVEINSRWKNRISEIEDLLNIKLLNNKFIDNNSSLLDNLVITLRDEEVVSNIQDKKKLSLRKKIRYSFLIFISQIPLLGRLISKKKRIKYLNNLILSK